MKNKITIHYCTQCGWLLRATWMSQELLTTFTEEITELSLQPGTGGIFNITANNQLVWSRKEENGFPEITELKRRIRDVIAPERNLGHIDRKKKKYLTIYHLLLSRCFKNQINKTDIT